MGGHWWEDSVLCGKWQSDKTRGHPFNVSKRVRDSPPRWDTEENISALVFPQHTILNCGLQDEVGPRISRFSGLANLTADTTNWRGQIHHTNYSVDLRQKEPQFLARPRTSPTGKFVHYSVVLRGTCLRGSLLQLYSHCRGWFRPLFPRHGIGYANSDRALSSTWTPNPMHHPSGSLRVDVCGPRKCGTGAAVLNL